MSALWDEAVELAPDERSAWLASRKSRGEPLVRQLEQMLAALDEVETSDFLDAPTAPSGLGSFGPGDVVGGYRLERQLGTGGMAEVWFARLDDGRLDRPVALKVLHRWRRGAELASRLRRERDILAALDHPRIARLLDAGVAADGQPWLALEYVDGENITAHADRLALDVGARVQLFRQVLLAVQHAHGKLVLHRDLKPSNILVTPDGWAKLLDFGIAKLLDAPAAAMADTELTRAAGRPLTPQYASPEQLSGRALSTASDIYSLGVVLYELLCGRRPHDMAEGRPGALEQAICEIDPPAPSQRVDDAAARRRASTARSLRRTLAAELDGLVLKALAREPSRRYTSVDAFLADVDRWLDGEPVLARPPGMALKLRKFVDRHRLGTALGSAALAGLLAVTAVAESQRRRAVEESVRATAARDFLLDVFRRADPERSRGEVLTAREVLEAGRRGVERSLDSQPRLAAELLQGIGGVQAYMGQYRQADGTLAEAIQRYERLGDARALALARIEAAGVADDLGDPERAARLLDDAEHVADQHDSLLAYKLQLGRGWVARGRGRLAEARDAFRLAQARAETAWGSGDPRTLAARRALALTLGKSGEHTAAMAELAEVRRLASALPEAALSTRERLDIDLDWLNVVYVGGRYGEAASEGRSLAAQCRANLGADGPTCSSVERLQILALLRTGRVEDAARLIPGMLNRKDRNESPRRRAEGQLIALRVLSEAGQLASHPELRDAVERLALADPDNGLGNAIPQRASVALAEAALQAHDLDAALRWVARATAAASLESWLQTRCHLVVGLVRERQGRLDDAVQALGAAAKGHANALGETHPMALLVSLNLARVQEALGDREAFRRRWLAVQPVVEAALGADAPLLERARHPDRTGFFS